MSRRDARRAWIPCRRCVTSEAPSLWTHERRAEARRLHNECAYHQDSGTFPRSSQSTSQDVPNITSVRLPRHGILHAVSRAEPIGGPSPVQLRLGEPAASAVTVGQPEVTDGNLTAPIATLGALSNRRELLSHPKCAQICQASFRIFFVVVHLQSHTPRTDLGSRC
jgi:hypothetical protein